MPAHKEPFFCRFRRLEEALAVTPLALHTVCHGKGSPPSGERRVLEQNTTRSAAGYYRCADSIEDYSFIAVHQNAMFEVKVDSSGEHNFLEVFTFADHVLRTITVTDATDILVDDGTFIQFFGDKMGRCSDDLHASSKSPVIGVRTRKRWQEGMMDIDDLWGSAEELSTEHLHVFSENDQIDPVLS